MFTDSLTRIINGKHLERTEVHELFGEIMDDGVSEAQKSAFLVAMRMKGETAEEITGAALAMRERVTPLRADAHSVVDTCGTGGDGRQTINVSTIAAIVAASAGVLIAKHGNRAVSSKCGSADILAALGVNIELDAEAAAVVLAECGITFLFAQRMHPAMRNLANVRRELGVRTIFNVLGPLTNPAFAQRQVIGVFSPALVSVVARVLRSLGTAHALVVHSEDGLDEISVSAPTRCAEIRGGEILDHRLKPEALGVLRQPFHNVTGGSPRENAAIARSVLNGDRSGAREFVLANAGAAIYVGGKAGSIREGVEIAREAIDSGRAAGTLDALVAASLAAAEVAA